MGGIVEVLASHGDTQLGGDDFDERLAGMAADYFEEEYEVDLRRERRAWARLLRAAEEAKIELSSHPFAWIKEEYLAEKEGVPLHLEYEISRADFIDLIDDLLAETVDAMERVLDDGEVDVAEIDQVLLVGGSTRIPAVWERVAAFTGVEPRAAINPDEAVALGAAVQGAIIAGEPIDAILVDVTPHSMGIAVAELRGDQIISDRYKILIRRNTTIPVTEEELFTTVFPGQDAVQIKVYQGEARVASQNDFLGEFFVEDLEPARPGELAQVTVRFDFDVDGILHVRAQDRHTGREKEITVEASRTRLVEEQIVEAQTMLAETETASSSMVTDALAARARRLLAQEDLDNEVRAELNDLLADLELAQERGNTHRVDELSETLLDILFDYEE
jgi:molecular chaperone DnaK